MSLRAVATLAVLLVGLAPAVAQAQPAPGATSGSAAQPAPEVSAAAAQVALESTAQSESGEQAAGESADSADPSAADDETEPGGLTLSELLGLAATHPLIDAAQADLDAADARRSQSQWAPFSNWSFSTQFTFIPPVGDWETELGRTRDVQWSASILDWGPWIRLGVSGAIPLYTFGKISGVQDAAEAGVQASTVGVERARDEVSWQMRRAYLTLLLARDILYLIDDGRGYLDDAREELQKRIDSGEGGGATLDLYKIDAMSAEVDARELQAQRLEQLSLTGIGLLAGLEPGQEIADLPLAPFAVELKTREEYVDLARRERTDLRMLDAAIDAQRAKVDIEFARYFPDIALAAQASYAYSNVAVDQHNPWLYDPINTNSLGAALVIDYPLDFGMDYHRVQEAEAVLRRLESQREALLELAETDVTDAYTGLVEAQGRMAAWDRGRRAAKRWMLSVLQGMTLGLLEASDLTDGLVAYFQNELSYLNSVYDLDVAWAKLALATGEALLDGAEFAELP